MSHFFGRAGAIFEGVGDLLNRYVLAGASVLDDRSLSSRVHVTTVPTRTPILQTIDVHCCVCRGGEGRKIHTTWRWLARSWVMDDDPAQQVSRHPGLAFVNGRVGSGPSYSTMIER